jgi:DNA invertase Pin-like site-specific DNA recombinase
MDYGYTRSSFWKAAPSSDAQREAIAAYAARRGWDFGPERQLFLDGATTRVADLRDREAGAALFTRLRRGDRLIAVSLDRIFHRAEDAAVTLGTWVALGVELHVLALGGPVEALEPVMMARAMAALEQAARSERAAAAAMKSRFYNRPVNGSARYGFEWRRRPGSREWELVPDEQERTLMRAMLKWAEAGYSIDQIRQHLAYGARLDFFKRRGRKRRLVRWTADAVWRRIQAERRLRAQEAQQNAGTA